MLTTTLRPRINMLRTGTIGEETRKSVSNSTAISSHIWRPGGIFPFTLYYVLGSDERRKRDGHNGIPGNFRQ
ncbi:unnamed protein product [Peronospora farinosa]|uniref:Uncharacterized protein n=1 Tax=Peronospora farinosa TaxID=134698 RepID=A0ABN8CL09_9STRA|nr:unnamed protein product [Peronospora farinosa]